MLFYHFSAEWVKLSAAPLCHKNKLSACTSPVKRRTIVAKVRKKIEKKVIISHVHGAAENIAQQKNKENAMMLVDYVFSCGAVPKESVFERRLFAKSISYLSLDGAWWPV